MKSKADLAKGHGVLSAHDEQVALAREVLRGEFEILENSRSRCDITHYHSINPEFYLEAMLLGRRSRRVGYVHFLPETVENSIRLPRWAKSIFYRYIIAFYKQMDDLVTVNPCFIDKLNAYGIPKSKITYIPNFVSEEEFYPLPQVERLKERRRYGLDPRRFTVFCAGQLQKRKGVLEYIQLARRFPSCQFVWAGGFSFGKISEGYDEINQAMKRLPENMYFLGMVDRSRMNGLYNMADVMLLPSYEELFPMTVLEAMNCNIPVIVRDLAIYEPILKDYVQKGKNQEEFQQLLSRLSQDPVFYLEACHRSLAGHAFYSREHVGEMWKTFYRRITEKGKEGYSWKRKELRQF